MKVTFTFTWKEVEEMLKNTAKSKMYGFVPSKGYAVYNGSNDIIKIVVELEEEHREER